MLVDSSGASCPEIVVTPDEAVAASVVSLLLSGSLSKWTNYVHGWQKRYFVLKDGMLSYYKSEQDVMTGCRGSISIEMAEMQVHDFDECRFDVSVVDCTWYLRAQTTDDRQKWIEALRMAKLGCGLSGTGSMVSLTSLSSLVPSVSKQGLGLPEKLDEVETYREILMRQLDMLQFYFDHSDTLIQTEQPHDSTHCSSDLQRDAENPPNVFLPSTEQHLLSETLPGGQTCVVRSPNRTVLSYQNGAVDDFKCHALTFKATSAELLVALQQCAELMGFQERAWKIRLEKEVEKRKHLEASYARAKQTGAARTRLMDFLSGPDLEEGPHSSLSEDQWHDALDFALEPHDQEDKRLQRVLSRESESASAANVQKGTSIPREHALYPEIEATTLEQLHYAQTGVEDGVWQLFVEDGELKMFKRDLEIGGRVCDPLKAVHSVKGITARECCHYFFQPDYKMDWDTTVIRADVLERVADDTMVFQQLHKKIWPACQRESLFWSHMRRVPAPAADKTASEDVYDTWIVCNHDTEHENALSHGKILRVGLTIAMLCETVIAPRDAGIELQRSDITCKIVYVAQVNPGGWAPSSILREVYKREYPNFLKRFTQYVRNKTEGLPIML